MYLCSQLMYQTQSEKKRSRRHASKEFFSANDLLQMSELNPPKNVMPNGNVGTPTSVFQALIQQCAMPSRYRQIKLFFCFFKYRY